MSEKSFWQFSLITYAVSGVESLLLRLQNEFGADINMLLFCYWLGLQQKIPASEQWVELQKLTAEWQKKSILPLRSVRQFLKQQSGMANFRRSIQTVEIEAERLQQEMMEHFSTTHELTSFDSAPEKVAWQNLETYFASLLAVESLLVTDISKELHELIDLSHYT
ncbi:MAG: TIGR02444 family protein [Oceanicoccus sp.]